MWQNKHVGVVGWIEPRVEICSYQKWVGVTFLYKILKFKPKKIQQMYD